MIHKISYDGQFLAYVSIEDSDKARAAIKEMVEFWGWWEEALANSEGDYTRCWLRQLATFLLYEGHIPEANREGWYPLDGSYGIKVYGFSCLRFDNSLVEIEP